MNINGQPYRTIWINEDGVLSAINQQRLPHRFEVVTLATPQAVCDAIRDMTVRGAGLIGAAAAYGVWVAAQHAAARVAALPPQAALAAFTAELQTQAARLKATRPTASNLAWAVQRQLATMAGSASVAGQVALARAGAQAIADEDAEFCRRIGLHGLGLIQGLAARKPGQVLNVLTHCNAGWLAFVDHGSALSPVYAAHDAGIPVHVWVDETRPRNQGASLTAWELASHGVAHTLIADNAGGHLMQHGQVDLVITGADRVTRCGDAANKIGTYLKALAAHDNQVPFYVALPSSTFDFTLLGGVQGIEIEERSGDELRFMPGKLADGRLATVQICPDATPARNWGFDVTPARLITGLITERGICPATEAGVAGLYPEEMGVARGGADEGVVKYSAEHRCAAAPYHPLLGALDALRTRLFDLGLVGVDAHGVGYGNVSVRDGTGFVISGSATGGERTLGASGYCRVHSFDLDRNRVSTEGPLPASSESMTHGAVYAAQPQVQCVLHIHHRGLWQALLRRHHPATPASVPYGTPEMARAVWALVRASDAAAGLWVMAGHEEGLIAYGPTLDLAMAQITAVLPYAPTPPN